MKADKFSRVELSCINPLEKKAWNSGEAFFQELKQGYVQDFPIDFCRLHLHAKEDYLLNRLGELFQFELCVGLNGKVWVKSEKPQHTVFTLSALQRMASMMTKQFEIG